MSAGAGVEAIAEARGEGLADLRRDAAPLRDFTADAYLRPDGVIFHTYPSLKPEEDRAAALERAPNGTLAPSPRTSCARRARSRCAAGTIADATGGHVGVEPRMPIIYTEGVSKRGMSLERFVDLTSTNAAKVLGLYPRKGAIAPGSDADLAVFDPDRAPHPALGRPPRVRLQRLGGLGGRTAGRRRRILRGKIVVEDGKLAARRATAGACPASSPPRSRTAPPSESGGADSYGGSVTLP